MIDSSYAGRMRLLVQTVQDLSHARDLSTVQTIVRNAARKLTDCDGATVVMRDGAFCHYVDEDAIAPLWKGSRFPLETCISGWSMLNREPAVIPDIYVDKRIPHDAYRPTFVKSLVMVPIRTGHPIGAIGNYWADSHAATPEEVTLLQALADSTSIALENVQLYQSLEAQVLQRTEALQDAYDKIKLLSNTDELTGLLNRRGFLMMGEQALRQAQRARTTCAIIFADVDGLKHINDSLGHETGDAMIAHAARVLREVSREADLVGRLGGDEFCILSVGEDGAEHLTARLRQAFASSSEQGEAPYALAASLGSAVLPAGTGGTLEDLIAQADRNMYEDKRRRKAARAAATEG